MENLLSSFWFLWLIAICGMITHFAKKKIKGETFTEIKTYISTHFKSFFVGVIITTVGVIYYYNELAQGSTADIIAVFAVGYMFESMLNKYDGVKNAK